MRCGAVRCGAVRCGALRRGAGQSTRCGAPAAAKIVLGVSSLSSTGLESSGSMSSTGPELEAEVGGPKSATTRVSANSSDVASEEAMEVSACDGRVLTHVGAVTRCKSERSSSPVESEDVGCAIALGIAPSCEGPGPAGFAASGLPPLPRLRPFFLLGVLTSGPELVPPRAGGDTSPPVSDSGCGASAAVSRATGSTSSLPVGPLGSRAAVEDEATEDEEAASGFFFSFPCFEAARTHVESESGGGCGGTEWWPERWPECWPSSTSRCLCVESKRVSVRAIL